MPGELLSPSLLSSDIQGYRQNSGVVCNHGSLSLLLLSSGVQIPPVNYKINAPFSSSVEPLDQIKSQSHRITESFGLGSSFPHSHFFPSGSML